MSTTPRKTKKKQENNKKNQEKTKRIPLQIEKSKPGHQSVVSFVPGPPGPSQTPQDPKVEAPGKVVSFVPRLQWVPMGGNGGK